VNTARIACRYLTALLVVDVLVQFFLAGAGVFRADAGEARDSRAFDPHRRNGMIIQGIGFLVLISAIAARSGRWKVRLPHSC
jgi:hypothetical protein